MAGLLVDGLFGSKARLVNTVVDIVVHPLVDLGHRLAQRIRGKVEGIAG